MSLPTTIEISRWVYKGNQVLPRVTARWGWVDQSPGAMRAISPHWPLVIDCTGARRGLLACKPQVYMPGHRWVYIYSPGTQVYMRYIPPPAPLMIHVIMVYGARGLPDMYTRCYWMIVWELEGMLGYAGVGWEVQLYNWLACSGRSTVEGIR